MSIITNNNQLKLHSFPKKNNNNPEFLPGFIQSNKADISKKLSFSLLRANYLTRPKIFFGYSYEEHRKDGANYDAGSGRTNFSVWAPNVEKITLEVRSKDADEKYVNNFWDSPSNSLQQVDENSSQPLLPNQYKKINMRKEGDFFVVRNVEGLQPGDYYTFLLEKSGQAPIRLKDPRSKSQPFDSNGWSAIYDDNAYVWNDNNWITQRNPSKLRHYNRELIGNSQRSRLTNEQRARLHQDINNFEPPQDMIAEEIHINTFTKEGNFESAKKKIDKIAGDGIYNTIEIMPVAEFPGKYSWGYDGIDLFAVESSYADKNSKQKHKNSADQLKNLVDYAHQKGINVVLDVVYGHVSSFDNVYNNFGNYEKGETGQFGNKFDYNNKEVRKLVVDNVLRWLEDFHIDGLRLDNTISIPRQHLKVMIREIRQHKPEAVLIAECSEHKRDLVSPLHGRDLVMEQEGHIVDTSESRNGDYYSQSPQYDYDFSANIGLDAQWNMKSQHIMESLSIDSGTLYTEGKLKSRDDLKKAFLEGWAAQPYYPAPENPNPREFVNYISSHDVTGSDMGKRRMIHEYLTKWEKNPAAWQSLKVKVPNEGHLRNRIVQKLSGLYRDIKTKNSNEPENEQWNNGLHSISRELSEKFCSNIDIQSKDITLANFEDELKRAYSAHRLGIGILFMLPGHKMFLMGDEYGELNPFDKFENDRNKKGDRQAGDTFEVLKEFAGKHPSEIPERHPSVIKRGKELRDSSRLNEIEKFAFYKGTKAFTKDLAKFWTEHPALRNESTVMKERPEGTIKTWSHPAHNLLAVKRFDTQSNDEVIAIMNLDNNNQFNGFGDTNFADYILDGDSAWEVNINSSDPKYIGANQNQNSLAILTKQNAGSFNIPAKTIVILTKQ